MVSVAPVSLRFVRPEWSHEVPSPPHDALSADARRRHLIEHPRSYLGVTRSPDDLDLPAPGPDALVPTDRGGTAPSPARPTEAERGQRAAVLSRASLELLLADGTFEEERPPGLYLYRLVQGDHHQTGVVCGVATADYDGGLVRVHEQINRGRADLLAHHLRVVGAQSSPIAMAFRQALAVEALIERVVAEDEPLLDIEGPNLRQTLWAVADPGDMAAVTEALAHQPVYLIDGHHRAAAASSDRRTQMSGPARAGGREPMAAFTATGAMTATMGTATGGVNAGEHRMLSVLFPLQQLDNEAFHRVLDGVDVDDLIERLGQNHPIRAVESIDEVIGRKEGWIALAAGGPEPRWWLVELPPPTTADGDGVDIEPTRLGQHVLAPLLGIEEPTTDPRLSYRPGPADAEAAAALRLEPGQIEFWMRPVPLTTLSDMADRGLVMPPKSTYFQPKVQSGLFVRITDPTLNAIEIGR